MRTLTFLVSLALNAGFSNLLRRRLLIAGLCLSSLPLVGCGGAQAGDPPSRCEAVASGGLSARPACGMRAYAESGKLTLSFGASALKSTDYVGSGRFSVPSSVGTTVLDLPELIAANETLTLSTGNLPVDQWWVASSATVRVTGVHSSFPCAADPARTCAIVEGSMELALQQTNRFPAPAGTPVGSLHVDFVTGDWLDL